MTNIITLEQATLVELKEMVLYHNITYKNGKQVNTHKMNKNQLVDIFKKLNLEKETINIINRARNWED